MSLPLALPLAGLPLAVAAVPLPDPPVTISDALHWPPDYTEIYRWRMHTLKAMRKKPKLVEGAMSYYAKRPVEFINHWVTTYDPRNAGKVDELGEKVLSRMPFTLFKRQAEMVEFLVKLIKGETGGLIEKCRDIGATWVCAAFSVWLWLFWDGSAVGWGSRKEALVDKLGDPDSIFEKIRIIIRNLPPEFLPVGFDKKEHMPFMRIINPATGATITGEAGDNIGRGGRKLIYFKDESAHYERPDLIEASLADNTNVQVDISSVNGTNNIFFRRREAGVDYEGGEVVRGRTNVLVLEWQHHPGKTLEWYRQRRARASDEGLLHVFKQEVDRDYSGSIDGVIIPMEWVNSAVNAAEVLGLDPPTGKTYGGLDLADEGGDKHSFAKRKSYQLQIAQDWGEGDPGQAAVKALDFCGLDCTISYDATGVGAGAKTEANRRKKAGLLPKLVKFLPWWAGGKVQKADQPMIPGDTESPTNEDFFDNLKAQGAWELRRRFEKTHLCVTQNDFYPDDELISIPPDLPQLQQLKNELAQPIQKKDVKSGKFAIDKKPKGTKSPNLFDGVVMAFHPAEGAGYDLKGAL